MNTEPSVSQRRVLEFFEWRLSNGENPPTYREICEKFGYRSPKAASDHVAALERKGYLVRQKGRARGVKLVKSLMGIPLFGRIPAGYPSDASSEVDRHLPIDPTLFGIRDRSNAFAVRVSGDSMMGRHIFDRDIVLLEKGKVPRKGDIVAAVIDNESTLKTLVQKNGINWLQAENPLYPDLIPLLELTIQGVARAVIRFLSI
jgi:repressor LexA